MRVYDSDFYRGRDEQTRHAAETILTLVQDAVPAVSSAIDLGCGVGTWLSVLRERGVQEIRGVDGDWVQRDALVIPPDCFTSHRLDASDVPTDRRYDLVISLELAEHLPACRSEPFVRLLTDLGDFILFSAAIPGQGGVNHVNEQWPEYWTGLFARREYVAFDIFRRRIWGDDRIAVHYRQNILLFVKRDRVPDLRFVPPSTSSNVLPLVHPRLFENKLRAWSNPTIRQSIVHLLQAIASRARRRLGARTQPHREPAQ